jgi:CubicO group peptidase (beta-lactamase class C family)
MFALLQQMELGKFKLDDRVNDYLADFKIKGENPSQPVSFRHLLTHTSGLPADFGPHPVWGSTVPSPLEVYLTKALKLKNPPLMKVIYSNIAYTLIAYLIEKFSGVPYEEYIQEHIFDPLGMKDTAFIPRPDMGERLAIPYLIDQKTGRHKPAVRLKANVWPAGIVYGTVTNQAYWLIANLNRGVFKEHRLISEETFKEVMTRQYDQFAGPISDGWLNESTGYGLTWWITQRKGDTYFAHSGSVSGYTAFLAGNLNKKTGFAILTNGHRVHKHLFELAVSALDLLEACRKN